MCTAAVASQRAKPTLNSVLGRARAKRGAPATLIGAIGGDYAAREPLERRLRLMKRSVLWVSSLLTLAAACGGRSTEVDDESPEEPSTGAGSAQGMGGSGGGQATAGSGGSQATGGSGGSQATGGSGGSQATGGSGGSQGPAGAAGTAGTTATGTKPTGEDQPCVSDADCTGFEATFCESLVTSTCLVRGCSVASDSCFAGKECCDLSAFGLPTLCIAAGVCQQ
jgi:hypothetical protein